MKRALLWSATLLVTLGLPGCPIYPSDDDGCFSDSDCGSGYLCDYDTGRCLNAGSGSQCSTPADCGPNTTCASDNQCHPGSCTLYQCVSGYTCQRPYGSWVCMRGNVDAGVPQYDSGSLPRDSGVVLPDAAQQDAAADVTTTDDASPDATFLDGSADASTRDASRDGASDAAVGRDARSSD